MWQQKFLNGHNKLRSHDADTYQILTHQWLHSARVKAETNISPCCLSSVTAKKDLSRKYLINVADPKCGFCNEHCETSDHLFSGCFALTSNEYKATHDCVGQYLHWKISN